MNETRWSTPGIVQDVRSYFRDSSERRQAAHDAWRQSRQEYAETYGTWSHCEECGEEGKFQ